MNLDRAELVITGVGYRHGLDVAPSPFDKGVKLNIGAAVASRAVERGARVFLIGRRRENMAAFEAAFKERWPGSILGAAACDVTDRGSVRDTLGKVDWTSSPVLVQSVGLSSGFYAVTNDNPYKLFEEIEVERALEETRVPLAALFNSIHELLPQWRRFNGGRCVVVNSMSAIRAYLRGGSHATAKGALHQAIRSAALEYYRENIFLTEVNPGIVDTGLYDHPDVVSAARDIAASFGQDLTGSPLPMMSPFDVADAVIAILTNGAHIVQLNMVAEGQFPNLGG